MQELAQLQNRLEEVQVQNRGKANRDSRGLYDSFSERHGRDLREFEIIGKTRTKRDGSEDAFGNRYRDRTRGELKELGSVNLMAVEEFAEVSDRYEFLNGADWRISGRRGRTWYR